MRRDVVRLVRQSVVLALALGFASCTNDYSPMQPTVTASYVTPTGLVTANPPQVFIGAGDISSCSNSGDEATAKLLDAIPEGTVYNLGDDAYNNGTTAEFACYHSTWGRHKARTKPSAGNHEYNSSGAAGYYAYFGAAAGDPSKGYYSFDLGAWHIIVLNSNISRSSGSVQDTWLMTDLAAHPNLCTLAYFHHPLYSSTGGTGSSGTTYSSSRRPWDVMYPAGVDLVLGGHRHFYERLAPMKPDGSPDPTTGIREIVVGSGGIGGGSQTNVFPTSEVRNGSTFGVLKLYLYDDSYAWKFIPVAGKTFTDSGSTACHGPPGGGGGGGVSATNSTVAASTTPITAGSGFSTITVTAKDGSGNLLNGATVVFASTGSGNTFTPSTATTGSNGVAASTLTSTKAEDKLVSAIINSVAITQKPTVTVAPDVPAALAFTTQPSNTGANAPITPAVVVEIRDQYGNRVNSSASVTVAIGTNPSAGTLTGTSPQTAVGGVATFSDLKINNVGNVYTLVAGSSGLPNAPSNTFNITPPTPSATNSTVSAVTPSFTAGGSSQIDVVVKDGLGFPMSGVTVTLSSTVGDDVITPPGSTDGTGATSGTVTATSAGNRTITALAGGVTLNAKPVLTVSAGPLSATTSTVSASPTSFAAGTGSSAITVTAKDAYGNPVGGSNVSLSASGTGNTFTPPSGSTAATGVFTSSLASTDLQTETVSAIAGGVLLGQPPTVTVTNQPPVAITHALLTSGVDTNALKVFTTPNISPAANALITVAVLARRSSGAQTPTLSGGGMATWTLVASVDFNPIATPASRLMVFRAMTVSPGSGSLTVTFANSQNNVQWIVSQWTGVDQTGTNGSGAIGQTGSARGDAVSALAVALAAFGNANNIAYGVVGAAINGPAVTPGTGFTEITETSSGETTLLEAEQAVNLNNVQASLSNAAQAGALGIEIKAP